MRVRTKPSFTSLLSFSGSGSYAAKAAQFAKIVIRIITSKGLRTKLRKIAEIGSTKSSNSTTEPHGNIILDYNYCTYKIHNKHITAAAAKPRKYPQKMFHSLNQKDISIPPDLLLHFGWDSPMTNIEGLFWVEQHFQIFSGVSLKHQVWCISKRVHSSVIYTA